MDHAIRSWRALTLAGLLALIGCGEDPPPDPSAAVARAVASADRIRPGLDTPELRPPRRFAHLLAATAAAMAGMEETARRALTDAVVGLPGGQAVELVGTVAAVQARQGHRDAARRLAERAAELVPEAEATAAPDVLTAVVAGLVDAGALDEAAAITAELGDRDPLAHGIASMYLLQGREAAGDTDAADALAARMIESMPTAALDVARHRTVALAGTGRLDAAFARVAGSEAAPRERGQMLAMALDAAGGNQSALDRALAGDTPWGQDTFYAAALSWGLAGVEPDYLLGQLALRPEWTAALTGPVLVHHGFGLVAGGRLEDAARLRNAYPGLASLSRILPGLLVEAVKRDRREVADGVMDGLRAEAFPVSLLWRVLDRWPYTHARGAVFGSGLAVETRLRIRAALLAGTATDAGETADHTVARAAEAAARINAYLAEVATAEKVLEEEQ